MLFMISYSFSPSVRNTAQDRFRKTGGLPGEGAKMIGRWHGVGGHKGFFLADSNDSVAMGKWLQDWTGRKAVSIIQLFIGLFSVEDPLFGTAAFQQGLQRVFIGLAFASVLLMLIPKPLILYFRSKNPRRNSGHRLPDDEFDQQHKLIGSVS